MTQMLPGKTGGENVITKKNDDADAAGNGISRKKGFRRLLQRRSRIMEEYAQIFKSDRL